jgi:putative ABC transport system permease protein
VIAGTWAIGLIRRRLGRLIALSSAVGLTVAFLGSLGAFFTFVRAEVGRLAAGAGGVDWQVALAPDAQPAQAIRSLPSGLTPQASEPVGYGDALYFRAATGETVQTTGRGKVIGITSTYQQSFPEEIRLLVGRSRGALLAQQTAANLHAGPGDTVTIGIGGGPEVKVTIDGVVDLPRADAFFQGIGASHGTGPAAPPDNVLLVPLPVWQAYYDPGVGRGTLQVHIGFRRALPRDPQQAFAMLLETRRSYEVRLAGAVAVADNLAARLGAARKEVAYGELLFLFLGLPGAAGGLALIAAGIGSGRERRRSEHALLRARGAGLNRLVGLALVEAGIVIALGTALGILAAAAVSWEVWRVPFRSAWGWHLTAAVVGIAAATASIGTMTLMDARSLTVVRARRVVQSDAPSDRTVLAALALSGVAVLAIWLTTRAGYEIVLAPEGTPTVSVGYITLVGPVLLWAAAIMIAGQATSRGIVRWRGLVARAVRPLAGDLAPLVAAWLARLGPTVVRSMLLLAVAVAFAVSTAIFDASFATQSLVDAQLSNGADVTASVPPGIDLGPWVVKIRQLDGVGDVEPMQHRFVYVGNDLQDLYGIDPARIIRATVIADAYFGGGNADAQLAQLSHVPDGVFVSAETVQDFQLHAGDPIRLRLLEAGSHAYVPIAFHVLGVVREFPTAPTDSFIVANASYVARMTHSPAAEILLIRTTGSPADVASALGRILPPASGAQVRDIITQRRITTSGLVAVDVRGLSAIELTFGALITVWAVALLLSVAFTERRRNFAILRALGARRHHIAAFVTGEVAAVVIPGTLFGAGLGASVAWILVRVLHGVFDPPPQHPIIPLGYLIALFALILAGVGAATAYALWRTARLTPRDLRDLTI